MPPDQSIKDRLFRTFIDHSPVAMALFYGPDFVITMANQSVLTYWNRTREAVLNKPLFEALPEAAGQGLEALLTGVYTTGERFVAKERPVDLLRGGRLERTYIDFVYDPFYETDPATGTEVITGITVICTEITGMVAARLKLADEQQQLLTLFDQSPVAIALISAGNLTVRMANPFYGELTGRSPDQLIGKPLLEALPELEGQGFDRLLNQVIDTGTPYIANEAPVNVVRRGQLETIYVNLTYQPHRDTNGSASGVLVVCTDVTQQVMARQEVETSEARFRSLIDKSPVAICLFVGLELVIEVANEGMIRFFGRGPSIVGKSVREVLTNHTDDAAVIALLTQVFSTGEPFTAAAAPASLTLDGVPGTYYFDLSLTPLRTAAGDIYAVLQTATDVTEQVLSRRLLEEAESDLRVAVEMAQLGTWSIDAVTCGLTYSERLIEWFGHNPGEPDYRRVIPVFDDGDQERVATAVAWALNPQSDGVFNEIYTVIHPQTGAKRILHTQGRTVVDATGKAVRLNGTAQDITMQRELQLALEQAVQERTEELAATNEELAATNEALMVSSDEKVIANNELLEANNLLSRSNENLEKFAYVASHDLQEPLRKIQSFGDLLKSRYGDQLGNGVEYLERMQQAATRMSALIRDLLTFSRIATQRETVSPVPLGDVLTSVLTDLDLRIQETGASVMVGPVPLVQGDRPQLEQLFQNLISNALKFHRADHTPVVTISSQLVAGFELPPSVKPVRPARDYYRIDVADNGIGFDEKYLDRIFQVFQRLSGRTQYAGTGIGLAICEKVVTNHGGAITARSQPGQGATFSVYLPA